MPTADTTAVNPHLIYKSGLNQRPQLVSHSGYFRLVIITRVGNPGLYLML